MPHPSQVPGLSTVRFRYPCPPAPVGSESFVAASRVCAPTSSKWPETTAGARRRFGARLRARETPAGSESGRVSRLPPPSRVQGAWPSYSPGRAASRGCASTQSKWPAKRPINRRFLPVVMTTLCHTPRWFLDSPQSDSGIHALQLRSVLKPSWQLPESALRRGRSANDSQRAP